MSNKGFTPVFILLGAIAIPALIVGLAFVSGKVSVPPDQGMT